MIIQLTKPAAILIMTVFCLLLSGPVTPAFAQEDPPAQTSSQTAPVTPSSVKVFTYLSTTEQAFTPSIGAYIVRFINYLSLLIGSFGILAVIVGGFFMLTAGGREEMITRGKDIIKFAVIGILAAVSAYWMVAAVQSLFY